jgi:hypothetical protein
LKVAARDPKPREIPVAPTGEMVALGRADGAFRSNLLLLFLLIARTPTNKPIDAASATLIRICTTYKIDQSFSDSGY